MRCAYNEENDVTYALKAAYPCIVKALEIHTSDIVTNWLKVSDRPEIKQRY